jgi:inositol oxygenase
MNTAPKTDPTHAPLAALDEWEDFLKQRYPEQTQEPDANGAFQTAKEKTQFRNYEAEARPSVREFYRLNHEFQTFAFVEGKKKHFLSLDKRQMTIWEALEFLNTLVDDSDPDIELSQLQHLLQTAEQIRRDGHPRWFILTGLIHDLGKILCLFGEPQWAVVGDTFPVGCAYSDKIVFADFFKANPDYADPVYRTRCGVYEEGIGLDQVHLSWGHDEYLYHVVKDQLPAEALAMIRYHSFYPGHRENQYGFLMNDHDRKMLDWVRLFNPYDLYTKSDVPPDVEALRPFYDDLIREYFPKPLSW